MSIIKVASVAAFMAVVAAPAFADDTQLTRPVESPKAQMDACMAKQRAANNGMTKKDMRKACDQYLQTLQNHPSLPADSHKASPQG